MDPISIGVGAFWKLAELIRGRQRSKGEERKHTEVLEIESRKAKALERIADYLDGLPKARPEIRGLFTQGITHKKEYEYGEAIGLFRQALAQGPTASEKAALLILIGNCFREQAKLKEAEGHYKVAEAAAVDAGDQEGLAAIYNGTGLIHKARGDHEQALQWFLKSGKIKKEIGDRAGLAGIYNNIGSIADDLGDYDQALEWYQESLKVEEEIGDRAGVAYAYNNIGGIYDSLRKCDKALEWYNKSLKISEDIGNRALLGTTLNNVGAIWHRHGNYDQALNWYHKSMAIAEEIGDRAGLATSYSNIGGVYYRRGDYDQALDCGRRALALFKEIGAKDSARQVKENIEALKAKGQERSKK